MQKVLKPELTVHHKQQILKKKKVNTGLFKLFGCFTKIFSTWSYSDTITMAPSWPEPPHSSFRLESSLCSLFCSLSPTLLAPTLVSIAGSCRICSTVAVLTQVLMSSLTSETLRVDVPPCLLPSSVGRLCATRRRRLMFILWWRKKAGIISLR